MWMQLVVVATLAKCLGTKAGVITCYNDKKECYNYHESACNARNDMYKGTRNITMDGFPCKTWESGYYFKDQPENYCRIPDGGLGPWCYIYNNVARWQYCFLGCVDCYNKDLDCFHSEKEECQAQYAYNGTRRHTVEGILCQRWDKDEPHSPDDREAPENYCRILGGQEGPWCYTTDKDKEWDFCLKDCSKLKCYDDEKKCFNYGNPRCYRQDNVYHGTWNKTVSGKLCQKWRATSPHNSFFKGEIENYCRNTEEHRGNGPYCYTTDENTKWELCFKDCADVTAAPPTVKKVEPRPSTTPSAGSLREVVEVCRDKPVDLLVLMDGSGSIKPYNFTKEKELVFNILKKLPAGSRVSVMQFSTNYQWELEFNSGLNLVQIQNTIMKIKYMNASTSTAKALKAAHEEIQKYNPRNITMLTITDGLAYPKDWENNEGSSNSKKIRNAGVKSYAVYIGAKTNMSQLIEIVGGKDHKDNIVTAKKFSQLDEEFAKRVVKKICIARPSNG